MSDGSANSKEVSLTGEDKVNARTLGDSVRGTVLHSASEAIVKVCLSQSTRRFQNGEVLGSNSTFTWITLPRR